MSLPFDLPVSRRDIRKALSLLLIPLFLAVIAARGYLDVPFQALHPLGPLVLNAVFVGLIPVAVAYISFESFRHGGTVSTLLLGAGMLFLGLAGLTATPIQLLPDAANLAITIFNIAVLLGMALELAGPLVALFGWRVGTGRRTAWAVATYTVVLAVTGAVVLAAALGLTPIFFVPGQGSTLVRDQVLLGAIASGLLASVLFFGLYRKRREDFFFWYGVGLALVCIGLITVAFIGVFGGLLNMVGRIEQYIGTTYILAAFLDLRRRAASRNVPIRELLDSFFAEPEAGYRQLIETAGDAIVVLGPGDRVLLWNTAAERMFEYTADEAIGLSFPELVLDGEAVPVPPTDGLRPVSREYSGLGRGAPLSIELTASRRIVDGNPITICIIRDLSERKRGEAALRESEQNLAASQAIAHIGSYHWDLRQDRIAWSDELYRILGLAPGGTEPTFEAYAGFIHPDDRDEAVRRIRQAADAGLFEPSEHRIVRPDGTVRTVVVRSEAVVKGEGWPDALIGVVQDVTAAKEAEVALREYAGRLARSNEELQRFAYVASHDLQEPLRSIVSFSQLLERRYKGRLGQDADDYIAFIVEGGNRMQRLIEDLLQLSRVETQARPLEPTDATRVAADALALFNGQVRELGGSVTIGPLPRVLADPAQLEQVFANLIGNALKYRREGVPPVLAISARRLDGMVEFSIEDNGIGIEEQYFDRIFEMFRRLHTHDQYEGTGIGLAVVKRIVERHGGTVRVESVPGEGSTFLFTLPAVPGVQHR